MSRGKSLDEILNGFTVDASDQSRRQDGTTLSIWLTLEEKARYKRIQQRSGRRFHVTLRELVLTAIERAEEQVS